MKSIWLPLALLAGTTGSALAQPNDLSTDEAISKAKLELEEARLHLEALLAEQAAADVIVEKRLAVKLAPDAEIQWGIDAGDCAEAASSCEDEAKVITKSFRIDSKGATCARLRTSGGHASPGRESMSWTRLFSPSRTRQPYSSGSSCTARSRPGWRSEMFPPC